jgi:hypothetical protein
MRIETGIGIWIWKLKVRGNGREQKTACESSYSHLTGHRSIFYYCIKKGSASLTQLMNSNAIFVMKSSNLVIFRRNMNLKKSSRRKLCTPINTRFKINIK